MDWQRAKRGISREMGVGDWQRVRKKGSRS